MGTWEHSKALRIPFSRIVHQVCMQAQNGAYLTPMHCGGKKYMKDYGNDAESDSDLHYLSS